MFKVGDIVKVTKFITGDIIPIGLKEGAFGIVATDNNHTGYIGVFIPSLLNGQGSTIGGILQTKKGWYCNIQSLEIVKMAPFEIGAHVKVKRQSTIYNQTGHIVNIENSFSGSIWYLVQFDRQQDIRIVHNGYDNYILADIYPNNCYYVKSEDLEEIKMEKPKFKIGDRVFAKYNEQFRDTDEKLMGVPGTVQGYYTYKQGINKYLVKYPLEFVGNEELQLHGGQLLPSQENYVGKPSNHNDCWYWDESYLMLCPEEKMLPVSTIGGEYRQAIMPESVFVKYEVPAYTDLQGIELHLGDSVLIMSKTAPRYNGWSGKVTGFDGGLVHITLDASGMTVFRPKDTVIIPANSFLPANVSITTYTCVPNEINVILWNNKDEIVTDAHAKCSPSDKFDFFYGLYKIALPRLFGCKTQEDI